MSYCKLQEKEIEKIKRVSKITYTDYEIEGRFIPVENLMAAIEDLLIELDKAEEKLEELERDRDENYKPISYAEQVGYRVEDFYE